MKPWRIALLYSGLLFGALAIALAIVGLRYPIVYPWSFLIGALFIFGAPICLVTGLFVLVMRSIRTDLRPGGTAALTMFVICSLTTGVVFFWGTATIGHPAAAFAYAVMLTSPATVGIIFTAVTAFLIEMRYTGTPERREDPDRTLGFYDLEE